MQFRATMTITYEVADESLEEAYGTSDKADCLEAERSLMEDGDYFISMVASADTCETTVEEVR